MSAIKLLSTTHRRASISKENTVSHIYPLNVFSIGRSGYVESLRQDYMIFIPSWYWLLALQVSLGRESSLCSGLGPCEYCAGGPIGGIMGPFRHPTQPLHSQSCNLHGVPTTQCGGNFSILESNARQSKKDSSRFFLLKWWDSSEQDEVHWSSSHLYLPCSRLIATLEVSNTSVLALSIEPSPSKFWLFNLLQCNPPLGHH